MRSTYYPGVLNQVRTYCQGWFMYMRYTQGQNEEYVLNHVIMLSKLTWKEVIKGYSAF